MPPLTHSEEADIVLLLQLELNSSFARVADNYASDPDDYRQVFLQTLIDSIRECVYGEIRTDRKEEKIP